MAVAVMRGCVRMFLKLRDWGGERWAMGEMLASRTLWTGVAACSFP